MQPFEWKGAKRKAFCVRKGQKSHWGRKRKGKIARARRRREKEGERKKIIVALLVFVLPL